MVALIVNGLLPNVGVCCWKFIPTGTDVLAIDGVLAAIGTPAAIFMLKGLPWVGRFIGYPVNACCPTPLLLICIGLGVAEGPDCGLLKSAIIESFDISPEFSFSLVELANAGPNCSKSLLLDENWPLLLLTLVVLPFDLAGAPTKSSKSLSFAVLVVSEIIAFGVSKDIQFQYT